MTNDCSPSWLDAAAKQPEKVSAGFHSQKACVACRATVDLLLGSNPPNFPQAVATEWGIFSNAPRAAAIPGLTRIQSGKNSRPSRVGQSQSGRPRTTRDSGTDVVRARRIATQSARPVAGMRPPRLGRPPDSPQASVPNRPVLSRMPADRAVAPYFVGLPPSVPGGRGPAVRSLGRHFPTAVLA